MTWTTMPSHAFTCRHWPQTCDMKNTDHFFMGFITQHILSTELLLEAGQKGKCKDHVWQVQVGRPGLSISKTAALVPCFWFAVIKKAVLLLYLKIKSIKKSNTVFFLQWFFLSKQFFGLYSRLLGSKDQTALPSHSVHHHGVNIPEPQDLFLFVYFVILVIYCGLLSHNSHSSPDLAIHRRRGEAFLAQTLPKQPPLPSTPPLPIITMRLVGRACCLN